MSNVKVGRPGKNQLTCSSCKESTLPRNGDWFFSATQPGQQVFFCRPCERKKSSTHARTIPAR